MTAVLDEIWTLADLQQAGHEIFQNYLRGRGVQMVGLNCEKVGLNLFNQLEAIDNFVLRAQVQVSVGDQIDGRAGRDRPKAKKATRR